MHSFLEEICIKVYSKETMVGQSCISCGEFIITLGRKDIIYAFGKAMFAIKHFLADIFFTDQNFTDKNFHPIGLQSWT